MRKLTVAWLAGCLALFPMSAALAVVMVPTGDKNMAEAFDKAKAGLKDFLAKAENPPEGTYNYHIKVGIRDDGDSYRVESFSADTSNTEYFWLSDLTKTDKGYTATIGNVPEMVYNVDAGEEIEFTEADIADWFYMNGDKMVGNYTACAILKSQPSEQLEQTLASAGLSCN